MEKYLGDLNKLKVAFFGTSDKSTPILQALHKNFDLRLCVTKKDRVVGRKQKVQPTQVKNWAIENNVDFIEISSVKGGDKAKIIEQLIESNIDLAVVADFQFILPSEILNTPKYKMINVHFSLLPKYRGASPFQFVILNEEAKTGVSYYVMGKGMDDGPIINQIEYNLTGHENSQELQKELFDIAANNLAKTINNYVLKNVDPIEQDHTKATYCYSKTNPKSTLISKMDAKIDWDLPNSKIYSMIRAFYPWPVAWTTLNDLSNSLIVPKNYTIKSTKNKELKIKIFDAKYDENTNTLTPINVQVEGSKKITWDEFKNGYLEK